MQAGVGKSVITPRVGTEMMGFGKRSGVSQGIHDDLLARALVLDDGEHIVVLCSVELCFLRATDVAQIRKVAAARCNIPPENIWILTTHTHSGPAAHNADNWDRPFSELVTDAISAAYESQQPAQLGIGAGLLIGYNIDRRWLDRPTDPAVGVIRVDTADGRPLAVLGNYACHAVVMGYDNLLISGDWPGYACRLLEETLGPASVAIFTQGGAGNVNPLTETVRQRLAAGHPVQTIGELTSYYGDVSRSMPDSWNIEDRAGGTFTECETLARAYNAEVLRIWQRIQTSPTMTLWSEQVMVEATLAEDEPPAQSIPDVYSRLLPDISTTPLRLEIDLMGIGDTVIASQPGESFSETSVEFRKTCQQLGYRHAMLMTYANGSYGYLPPENAFAEGGYEVSWPLAIGISRHIQARVQAALDPILQRYRPR